MRLLSRPAVVPGPLEHDREVRRWYADGGHRCLVLSAQGNLLEPLPTYGPATYRLIATEVDSLAARRYARAHGYRHSRKVG
jgi:hypothetical protein